ncbi:MAG: hypothetical protein ACHQD8_00960 [Chitinophagales bacterium]
MKRFLTIAAALMTGIATLTFTGCGTNNTIAVYPNAMTATIKGVLAFSASGSNISVTKTNGTLIIFATATSKSKITITIPQFSATPGTMAINNIGLPACATYDSLGHGTALLASTGTITFTTVSPYLEGTFSFVCSDSTKITEGTFKTKAP